MKTAKKLGSNIKKGALEEIRRERKRKKPVFWMILKLIEMQFIQDTIEET